MKRLAILALLLLTAASDPPEWTRPTAPFRIAGNIYYVGTEGLAAYLITTPKGAILLDGTMEENVPAIEANIRTLGVKLSDVKILLNSHAHFDHAGGLAALKRDTGATMMAMAGDRWALEHGTHFGLTTYPRGTFPAVKVDHVLHDGEVVAPRRDALHCACHARPYQRVYDMDDEASACGWTEYGRLPMQHDGRGQSAGRQHAISGDRQRFQAHVRSDGGVESGYCADGAPGNGGCPDAARQRLSRA